MFNVLTIFNAMTAMRYILPIVLMVNISTVFAQPVCAPSAQKEELLIPRQSIGELDNRGLECWEFGLQNIKYSQLSFRPLSGEWIESDKLGENGSSKFSASRFKFIEPEIKVSNIPDKTSKQNSTNNGVAMDDDIGDKFWHWLVIFLICCSPYIGYAQRLN